MDDEPKLGQHGGPRVRGQRASPENQIKHGAGPAYIRARLARDAAEGSSDAAILLQGVQDGRISPFAAACEMNYCRRPEPNGRGSENAAKRRDWALHKLFHPRPRIETLAVVRQRR